MSKRTKAFGWVIAAGLGLAAAGCEEPPQVVDTVPPGLDSRAAIAEKQKEKDEPEALGESGASSKSEIKAEAIPDIPPAPATAKGEYKTTKSGVRYTTVKEGHGAVAKLGQYVKVHYTGTLDDGRKFDSTHDRGDQPSRFLIGVGKVIKGWDEAVPGMKIGEVRKLDVPANAGYGALGKGPVPPNANLHFEIELVDAN